MCVAAADVISIEQITSPAENGLIEFSDASYREHIARYLRRRFGM